MAITIKPRSVWDGVPDADVLQKKLALAQDPQAPLLVRQEALSYLSGAIKVLAGIEKRQALADYLRSQVRATKTKLYYSGSNDAG